MSQIESTILGAWPELKEDLQAFLTDTDAWIISWLKEAHETRDWDKVYRIIEIMEMVHNMSHNH